MTDTPKALELRGVRKSFDADRVPVRALRGVDLAVEQGEFVAITGRSGSGKSTLLNMVAGLGRPDGGEILLAGKPVHALSADQRAVLRRRHVGLVFQFFNLIDALTVEENVAVACAIAGRSRREAAHRAQDLLDLLGLSDKRDESPSALSGGQRQRLAIARALANQPTLLLADEPTGALDSAGAAEILELLRRLHAGGQTILLATHDAVVSAAADRTLELRDGQIVEAFAGMA